MLVNEQELREPLEGPVDMFEILKAAATSSGVVQVVKSIIHIG